MFRAGSHLATDGSNPLLYTGLDLTDIIASQAKFLCRFFNCMLFLHIKAIDVAIAFGKRRLRQYMFGCRLKNSPLPIRLDIAR